LVLAASLLLSLACPTLAAEAVNLRLRASWGGGAAVAWSGSIEISAGQLGIDKVLGVEADAPGSVVQTEEAQIDLVARTPRRYDGLDLLVTAPRDALLRFEFKPGAGNQPSLKFEVPVEQLLQGRFATELDKSGNRFAVHRSPGDMLRFEIERDHLVFRGGERLQATIVPHLPPVAAGASLKCVLRLLPVGSDNAVWQAEHEFTLADDGSAAALPVETMLPQTEGVYELVAELQAKRFGTSFVRGKPIAERRVQLVVLSQKATPRESGEWAVIGEFDPAHPRLWDRMLRLPSMKMLAGFNKGPLGNEPTGTRNHLDGVWSTMKPTGWQAYPLPITNVGEPHILEIEFPSDLPQSLAISIVEPNAAGVVTPLGLDSGIDVDSPAPGRTAQVLTHRLAFWPRTNSPLVLLANRREDAPAVFGKIRVLSGPTALPVAEVGQAAGKDEGRMVAAYFDKPLFPENFSVAESLDARTGRAIDDWQVFHRGVVRFAEYLKYSGHNAAVVSVVCEGSALYPSEVLAPTPKYDSGAFSESAADPLRKDVVEALLRVFDREELAFVPAIQFSSLLPELEQLKASAGPSEAEGIDLVTAEGRRWIESHPPRRGVAPYYNLLDPRVQQAMRRVVLEVAERYADHSALRGVAIQISGDTYAQLPDDACGLDAVTLERFARETGITFPADEPTSAVARWQWIQRQAHDKWLAWRAAEVAKFYRDMQEDLQAVRPNLQLLLCPVEPLQSRRMQQRIRSMLPTQDQALAGLLHVGLDPEQLRQIPGLVFARPHYLESSLLQRLDAARSEINHSPQLDQATRGFATSSALSLAEPLPLRLEAFDRVSPFGYQNTHTFLMSHLSPVGVEARKRYVRSLTKNDGQWILDGGQMLLLGQEAATRRLLTTLQQLPAAAFVDVPPAADARTQPLILRRWSDETHTWLYLLNDSSWPVTAEIDLAASGRLLVETIGGKTKPTELASAAGVATWKGTVEPFDLVALRVAQPDAKVMAWRAETNAAVELALREQIREIRLRANTLRSPPPVDQLANDSFEQAPVVGRQVPRWSVAEGTGITVNVDQATAKSGTSSLHLVSRSPRQGEAAPVVWVRSEPIPTPSTGRLALWVWLKVADAKHQPKLRLAIEGRLDGQPYYRRANVGASENGRNTQPLQENWSPFLFPVDDLPTTGLTDLQIGFDLMGEGEVWIDDVQIFDLWFQDVERDSLLKSIALADFQVQEGKVGDAFLFLESHWPQFLRHHVALSEPRVATLPSATSPPPASSPKQNAAPPSGKSPSMMEGMRRWWPRMSSQK
jgi:hypothetical protein